ncbi:MAG: exonuclease domain-containing protein [Oscillospiraceae bacterium]
MQYIILDMEWNQPWPGSYSAKKQLPSPIRGEIIQIGAVRMTQTQQLDGEFQILIRPKYYKKMNRKVASLTGIKDAALKEHGVEFTAAMEQFKSWCADDSVFLTWGFDDIAILRENLALHGLDDAWTARWYNAQLIFNAQTDGATSQRALKTAMEMMGIAPTRPAHDALGDAYHTALICAKLRLGEGIEAYEQALKSHENGFHGAQMPGCIHRSVLHGYKDKTQALGAVHARENPCPVCGRQMRCGRWLSQPGKRCMTMAVCDEHGEFLVRLRLADEPDGTLRVSRLVYEGGSEAAESYRKLAEKPRRRPRRRKAKAPARANE